jgi:hypothetical protein
MSNPRYTSSSSSEDFVLRHGPQATKIDWKDPENALTKLYPGQTGSEDEEDMVVDSGSFFNFFEKAEDPIEVSPPSASFLSPTLKSNISLG